MAILEIKERFVASTLVARALVEIARKSLNIFQVVELTYLAHGWSFVNLRAPLVSDNVYAWKHGPVYPELYETIKSFENDPVEDVPRSERERAAGIDCLEEVEMSLVEAVYKRYKEFSGYDLMKLTREPGTPWHETWRLSQVGVIIGNDLIRDYYINKARRQFNDQDG